MISMQFITNGNAFPFKDEEHFENHCHYLFRTEKEQYRTNNSTKENVLLLPIADKWNICRFGEDLGKRKAFETEFINRYKNIAVEQLCMLRADYMDADAFVFTPPMIENALELADEINNEFGTVVLLVAHCDQMENYLHIHFIIRLADKEPVPA